MCQQAWILRRAKRIAFCGAFWVALAAVPQLASAQSKTSPAGSGGAQISAIAGPAAAIAVALPAVRAPAAPAEFQTAAAPPTAATPAFDAGNTAWLMTSTVLVLLMTLPGIILFYGGMLRTKNVLSIVAQTLCATGLITLAWSVLGYSLAFTPGNSWVGDFGRLFADGLTGASVVAHPAAPTVPEPVFFMFQLAFAIITFALVLGATAERISLSASMAFAVLWVVLIYAPVAHWIWNPTGWLAQMGHMDFAGGTVVHVLSGVTGLVAAIVIGPRRGFGREPMAPHNLLATVTGAGLLWIGWFGFNAGSAFEAGNRAAGALLATHMAACLGALTWGACEFIVRRQTSVLGMLTGAIAGLIGVTPGSGFVGPFGAVMIGMLTAAVCFLAVTSFKSLTRIDDTLDVFALHGVGGFVGTLLVPVFARSDIAPVTATVATNLLGAMAVIVYAALMTWAIVAFIRMTIGLRVDADDESTGLDLSQHGEMIAPS